MSKSRVKCKALVIPKLILLSALLALSKLIAASDISWWVVLSPLWVPLALWAAVLLIAVLINANTYRE